MGRRSSLRQGGISFPEGLRNLFTPLRQFEYTCRARWHPFRGYRANQLHLRPRSPANADCGVCQDHSPPGKRMQSRNQELVSPNDSRLFSLKQRSREFRLPNNTQKRAARGLIVKGYRNGYRRRLQTLLHDPMAASLADCDESVLFQNPTDLRSRKELEVYPTGTST